MNSSFSLGVLKVRIILLEGGYLEPLILVIIGLGRYFSNSLVINSYFSPSFFPLKRAFSSKEGIYKLSFSLLVSLAIILLKLVLLVVVLLKREEKDFISLFFKV